MVLAVEIGTVRSAAKAVWLQIYQEHIIIHNTVCLLWEIRRYSFYVLCDIFVACAYASVMNVLCLCAYTYAYAYVLYTAQFYHTTRSHSSCFYVPLSFGVTNFEL